MDEPTSSLDPLSSEIIEDLANCIGLLEAKRSIAQIEVAVGDNQTVLVFRHLEALIEHDRKILSDFCQQQNLVCYYH